MRTFAQDTYRGYCLHEGSDGKGLTCEKLSLLLDLELIIAFEFPEPEPEPEPRLDPDWDAGSANIADQPHLSQPWRFSLSFCQNLELLVTLYFGVEPGIQVYLQFARAQKALFKGMANSVQRLWWQIDLVALSSSEIFMRYSFWILGLILSAVASAWCSQRAIHCFPRHGIIPELYCTETFCEDKRASSRTSRGLQSSCRLSWSRSDH